MVVDGDEHVPGLEAVHPARNAVGKLRHKEAKVGDCFLGVAPLGRFNRSVELRQRELELGSEFLQSLDPAQAFVPSS